MLKWFVTALALFVTTGAQAQRVIPVFSPHDVYAEKSLVQQARFPRGSYSATVAAAFNGNPNVTISGITPGIAASRTSCQLPCFVQVSASSTTATGTTAPYEDLSYSWSSSDGCGATFTRPTDGVSVCSGTGQRQPEAVMRFDTAGTKTITLTAAGCAGSIGTPNTANQGICGSLVTAQTTINITVSAFSGRDEFADCGATPVGATGSITNPWSTMAQINTSLNAGGAVAIHLKPGCTWNETALGGIKINTGTNLTGVRLDKNYTGFSGANPIIRVNSGASELPFWIQNNAVIDDTVVSDIDFKLNTTGVNGVILLGFNTNDPTKYISNAYFNGGSSTVEVDCACSNVSFSGANTTNHDKFLLNVGLWNFVSSANPAFTNTDIGELGSAVDWHFRVGGSITGAGVSASQSQQIYPDVKTHALYQWVTCGQTGAGNTQFQRNYCFNVNWDGILNDASDHQIAQYMVIAENLCQYAQRCVDLGNRTNNQATLAATGSISGTTLTVTAFAGNTTGFTTTGGGSYLISGVNGGGSAITANTRIVGSATVNSGACTPSPCTGVEGGGTGTYAVSISQTFASGPFIGADSTAQFQYVVIAGNAMDGMAATEFQCGLSVTIRDNRQYNTPVAAVSILNPGFFTPPNTSDPGFRSGQPAQRAGYEQGLVSNFKVYRNKVFVQSTSYDVSLNPSLVFQGTWTGAAVWITDNTFVDARLNNAFAAIPFTDMLSSGAVIDRNTYSQTGSQLNAWYNYSAATTRTFAQWQAAGTTPSRWDASGINLAGATPSGWSSAAPTSWGQMN